MKSKRKFTPEFKTKVVLDSLQERESASELAKKYTLNIDQINKWKRDFKTKAPLIFTKEYKEPDKKDDQERQKLFEIIGQQKVEIDFLKKALS
jgi:transposase